MNLEAALSTFNDHAGIQELGFHPWGVGASSHAQTQLQDLGSALPASATVHAQEHDTPCRMSSQMGACANYNIRLPTENQIIKGDYYSVSKLLE